MIHIDEDIKQILELGQALAKEKYFYKLFDLILDGCMKFTSADSGTFYASDNGTLKAVIYKNRTLDARLGPNAVNAMDDSIEMNPSSVVTYTIGRRKIVRIDDIYEQKGFEIRNIKEFDAKYNYRTKSMMIIPIIDANNRIDGVIVLTNCINEFGEVVHFPEEYEVLVSSLTSQMATTMSNMLLIQELEDLLASFVEAMTTAIDARTPYNANHTINVADICMDFADYINGMYTKGEYSEFITDNQKEQLNMAAMLHDLGKMITPREVLNKATRLGNLFDNLINKLEKIRLCIRIDMLEKKMDGAEWSMLDLRLCNFIANLPGINIREVLTEDDQERIKDMGARKYIDKEGNVIPFLNDEEKKALSITKGTLTPEEREIVEQHVVYSEKMLDKIKFNEKYNMVKSIASSHHEYLDGSGYPRGIKADQINSLTRILTIADIYDSLTSNDRPYKGTVPVNRALDILQAMVNEGKLDKNLVRIFTDYVKGKERNKEK